MPILSTALCIPANPFASRYNQQPISANSQAWTVSSRENRVLACIECNAKKADRTPYQARMPLRRDPVRPVWKPLYGSHGMRIDSWSKFVSEAYWTVQLEE